MEDSVKAMMNVDKVVNVPTSSTSENDGNKNIDLFVVPHSRMRDLVSWPLSEVASAVDIQDLEPCLQAVYEAMWEMKTHEYIENNLDYGIWRKQVLVVKRTQNTSIL